MSEIMLPKCWIKYLWDCKFGSWARWPGATCRSSDTGVKRPRKGAERHGEKNTHRTEGEGSLGRCAINFVKKVVVFGCSALKSGMYRSS